ncbi:uncharacterized protein CTRU02_208175 [Colletotrichum truncatum]|uniref:Uncharacterized protein n=1 Tax=Colletotrichum truncatum TaxID=5467 RepID=A0ACC3YVJ4_COLTU|nr:uncharacterized protein CTRU02_07645 [Colletotrichum truncatum]KAF6791305.1 hypothetical protein CTRU02_07645 [Colletotrichum truncatum]
MAPKAAFIGATGATLSRLLAWTLMAEHKAVALVRDASKLHKILRSHNVPEDIINTHLIIVEGESSRSVSACIEVLRHNPEIIFSGITALPKFQLNPFKPVSMQDLTITGDSAIAAIDALRQLKAEGSLKKKPIFVPISSTGHGAKRDQPLALIPLYIWLLRVPQADTRAMEVAIRKAATEKDSPLGGYVMLRPPLLINGSKKGTESLRVGWTIEDPELVAIEGQEPGVTVGYTISREDLANWMFEKLVQGDFNAWNGKCVTVTY